jgi:hypothetical protein
MNASLIAGVDLVLPDEELSNFEALRASILSELAPCGDVETLLAERVVTLAWRLRRVARIETGLLECRWLEQQRVQALAEAASHTTPNPLLNSDDFSRPVVIDKAKHAAALKTAAHLEAAQTRGVAALAAAYVSDERSLARLARTESGMEARLYKALNELRQAQAARLAAT